MTTAISSSFHSGARRPTLRSWGLWRGRCVCMCVCVCVCVCVWCFWEVNAHQWREQTADWNGGRVTGTSSDIAGLADESVCAVQRDESVCAVSVYQCLRLNLCVHVFVCAQS